jgi:adenine-specific DNA-methyltransferase
MDKMRMKSVDLTAANIDKIAELFPAAITEALDEEKSTPEKKVYKKAVNFELLRSMLGDEVAGDEAYEFTWVGKREAIREAGRPIRKTLRPCVEESKNWDTTENLYIEGDNLDVLKLLQESYLGKVKMIYIDPPYNTGNDFVYKDKFSQSREDYEEEAGVYDEEANCLFRNTESNGRFHSDWCNMIYPRLKLAKDLLIDDGVIFISIDDNEIENLKKICNEIFGERNAVSALVWQKVYSSKNQARHFSNDYEFVLCYAKNIACFSVAELPRTEAMNSRYKNPDNDPRGNWKAGDCVGNGERKNGYYDVISPTGKVFNVQQGKHWIYAPNTMKQMVADNRIWFGKDKNSFPAVKQFLSEVGGRKASNLLMYTDYGHTDMAVKDLKKLFPEIDKPPFDTPKPIKLIEMLSRLELGVGGTILDFFSGSATTAHAVIKLNAEDGGKRKFIMVQIPEKTGEKSEAYKVGYKNICEIGKERIRRAGEKIKEEAGLMAQDLDIGFRVLKLADTNMKDVYYAADEYNQDMLAKLESNIKDDRTDMDLLYGCLLEWGLSLSMSHTYEEIDGVVVHTYNKGDLMACFAPKVSEKVVKEIAKRQPLRVVFRDSSFSSSPEKINVEEIFKLLAPKTSVKVL